MRRPHRVRHDDHRQVHDAHAEDGAELLGLVSEQVVRHVVVDERVVALDEVDLHTALAYIWAGKRLRHPTYLGERRYRR